MPRRIPWALVVAGALMVLLAALATLQYRWLGEVSQAERERMRATLQTRASDFSDAFDRELTHAYVAFHVDGDALTADPARTLADALATWQAGAMAPAIVKTVYYLEGASGASPTLTRLDPARVTLDRVDWPGSLQAWRARARQVPPPLPGLQPLFLTDAVDAAMPALIVNVPTVTVTRLADAKRIEVFNNPGPSARTIIVELNPDGLRHDLIDPLVAKYFGAGAQSAYLVTIVRRSDPSHVVYTSDPQAPALDASNADVTAGLFDLRVEEIARSGMPDDAVSPRARQRRGEDGDHDRPPYDRHAHGDGGRTPGRARGRPACGIRSGSLETIVAHSRRRNVAIGAGVLGLLVASVFLIIASAQRQQRLARQQIEFVAAVSHELRTPLAVIPIGRGEPRRRHRGGRAARQALRRAHRERGRRLSDMVERVMEFAGITSGHAARGRADVDLSRAIADAVGGLQAEARDRGVGVAVHANGSLPIFIGDADAIRSALQNIVGNAIKYSASGGTVDVSAQADGGRVRITVADRGLGIDAADLPHIFKPFYRGRRAVDAQVRGTGVGLSVVRHVVDAHHGKVTVTSRPGGGTTVVIELPVTAAQASA